jgi:hypothetical protein
MLKLANEHNISIVPFFLPFVLGNNKELSSLAARTIHQIITKNPLKSYIGLDDYIRGLHEYQYREQLKL